MGPMVYAVAYSTQRYQDETVIPNYEFDDSKKLTDPIRRKLFAKMYEDNEELTQIGYATTCITPLDISRGMSKFPPTRNYNLNEQAHDVTMALIDGVTKQNVKLDHVYVGHCRTASVLPEEAGAALPRHQVHGRQEGRLPVLHGQCGQCGRQSYQRHTCRIPQERSR